MKPFMCKECGRIRFLSRWQIICAMHLFEKWVYVKCPTCGKRHWFKRIKL